MMENKTYQSAVVVIPPREVWLTIQRIRQNHDRHFRRWMPHITMLYPFRPAAAFESAGRHISAICSRIRSFEIKLRKFGYFRHRKTNLTIFLEPEPADPLIDLQDRLLRAFPDCNDVNLKGQGFVPHLSVGQSGGRMDSDGLLTSLGKDWEPISFPVNGIHLIRRNDLPDDGFRVEKFFPFGQNTG